MTKKTCLETEGIQIENLFETSGEKHDSDAYKPRDSLLSRHSSPSSEFLIETLMLDIHTLISEK